MQRTDASQYLVVDSTTFMVFFLGAVVAVHKTASQQSRIMFRFSVTEYKIKQKLYVGFSQHMWSFKQPQMRAEYFELGQMLTMGRPYGNAEKRR